MSGGSVAGSLGRMRDDRAEGLQGLRGLSEIENQPESRIPSGREERMDGKTKGRMYERTEGRVDGATIRAQRRRVVG